MYHFHSSLFVLVCFLTMSCGNNSKPSQKPRVIVSTDIGGTDPDDNQSLIHLIMYSDKVNIEGIISSPYGKGRKQEILRMIDIYEKDYLHLEKRNASLVSPKTLRAVSKQGVISSAPYSGYTSSSEGSEWIVSCALEPNERPLWILVWGGLEDVAQALHDKPEIKKNIRVFWIGGPNKKWSTNAYDYIASHHPDLYFIESNATYRGWFMEDTKNDGPLSETNFYNQHIKGRGNMGADFINYYQGHIKMGDTPSLAYLLNGDPDDPSKPSWGGQHERINRSSKHIFKDASSIRDTVPAYGVVEWHFKGPEQTISEDSTCFWINIEGDRWPGFYKGSGIYAVRYSPKQPGIYRYQTNSEINELNNLKGEFVSNTPWPAAANKDDYPLGNHWYGDLSEPAYFLKGQQGAKTVAVHRIEYLTDWAERWSWLD